MTLETTELRVPGLRVREHTLRVPLVHGDEADGRTIELFARELADADGGEKPALVYLEGGPGFEAGRVGSVASAPGWVTRALREFRVLMLDQRGTGRSTPFGPASPAVPDPTAPATPCRVAGARPDPAAQAEYLTHFRADAIVDDAEALRAALDIDRWSLLGQSFGGFCVVAYLSRAPQGLREALVCGGLPPLGAGRIDDVYRHTYERVIRRTRAHYARYPEDRARALALRERADAGALIGPDGRPLSWRRLRQAGQWLGMSDGSARLHHLLELDPGSPAFGHDAGAATAFARNPLYAVVHESCYADGGVTAWSAQRMLPGAYQEDAALLTGEHVYPWMFEDYPELAPLGETAERLAAHEWPALYDADALRDNTVPVAAAIYADDMYVERAFAEETAGAIGSMHPWLTSEYDHDGLRADGERVFGRLLDLARGRV